MSRIALMTAGAVLAVGVSPRVAEARVDPCPTATLAYYQTSIARCRQGAIQVFDFWAALSIFQGTGSAESILVTPLGAPGMAGFELSAIGPVTLSKGGSVSLGMSFRMTGAVIAPPSLAGSWFANPTPVPGATGSFWSVSHSLAGGYIDDRGCEVVSGEAVVFDFDGFTPETFTINGLEQSSRYSRRSTPARPYPYGYCPMIGPAGANLYFGVDGERGVEPNWQFDRFDIAFEVVPTPEPGSLTLAAAGLVGLGLVAVRRRRAAR